MNYVAAGNTNVGQARDHNEDDLLVDPDHGVFVVADGMGGHDGGEIASALAIKAFKTTLAAFDDPEATAPWNFDLNKSSDENLINGCIQWANMEIHDASLAKLIAKYGNDVDLTRMRNLMGTTVVALRVGGERVTYGHVGDSRIYRLTNGALVRVTKDHSAVQDLVDSGVGTEDEVQRKMPGIKNIITKACGLKLELDVPVATLVPEVGDVFLLCSDGLSNEVTDSDIAIMLGMDRDPAEIVDLLIAKANIGGGKDNITAVVVKIG